MPVEAGEKVGYSGLDVQFFRSVSRAHPRATARGDRKKEKERESDRKSEKEGVRRKETHVREE